jgi:hypothetical protein
MKEKIMSDVVTLDIGGKELRIKPGNKGNIVVGGPALGQRFPVTLYAPSWLVLLDDNVVDSIKQYINDNKDELSWGK